MGIDRNILATLGHKGSGIILTAWLIMSQGVQAKTIKDSELYRMLGADNTFRAAVMCYNKNYTSYKPRLERRKLMKEVINYYNQRTYYKQNTTMEMAIDMFNKVGRYNLAIIVSGDGDLERAVELLRCKGIRIFVVSTEGIIAKELRNASDTYIDLNSIKNFIIKEKEPILSKKRQTKQLL